MGRDENEKFSEREAQERFDAALRGALRTPATPLKKKSRVRKAKTVKKKTK